VIRSPFINFARVLGVVCVLSLALPALAAANPGSRDFQQVFPYASRLCARAQAGKLGGSLRQSSAQVLASCATLVQSFDPADGAVQSAESTYRSTVKADRQQLDAALQQAYASHDLAAARQARLAFRQQMLTARQARLTAVQSYVTAVQSARKAFWSVIHSLRGGQGIQGESGTPPVPGQTSGGQGS